MLTSLAFIFLVGMALGWAAARLRLPSLLGMLLTGILLGPSVLNVLDDSLLGISADLRQLALIIILTRAGLSLNLEDLKRVGRPAILLCFVPACFEMAGMVVLAPRLLGLSLLDSAILGAVVAAVSPAVIVPKMLRLMEGGWGTEQSIPQMILAGASVDDVFVIVMFSSFTGLAQGGSLSPAAFLQIPLSILTGAAAGLLAGTLFGEVYRRIHVRDSSKVVVLLSLSFLFVALENGVKGVFPFSGLIAVMASGIAVNRRRPEVASRLSQKYAKLWVAAEVLLFVLVGATVDVDYALASGAGAVLAILGALIFRMAGVFVCLMGTSLTGKQRLFTMMAYTPKATVQAAIGSIPLSMGLACGPAVLTVAVLAILITAPLGAFAIDLSYSRLLSQAPRPSTCQEGERV